MKNTIRIEGIKRNLMGEAGVTALISRLMSKYKMLPQQFIRSGDVEIIVVCKSNLSESMYDLENIADELNNILLLNL